LVDVLGVTVITMVSQTVRGEAQAALLVIQTMTTSPLDGTYVWVDEPPTDEPFTVHEYVGVDPPLTPIAEKITIVPGATVVPGDADIETEGITVGLIVIIATLPIDAQPPEIVTACSENVPPMWYPKSRDPPVPVIVSIAIAAESRM
jgi:hypothetical protein